MGTPATDRTEPPSRNGEGMQWIPGGTFRMGSEDFYPEERPVHEVSVDGFWMDEHPVTAAEFRRFVRETKYVTVAERPLDPEQYPDAIPELLVPGLARLPQDPWARSTSTTTATGGSTSRGRTGSVRGGTGSDDQRPRPSPGRPRRLRGRRGLRDLGRARSCRPRPSGSSPPAAASTAPRSPGATSTSRTARRWPTPGRASSRGRT